MPLLARVSSVLLVAALAGTALAQTTVTDDFSSSANWTTVNALGSSNFSISGGRANYLSTGAAADSASYLTWGGGTYSYTSNWEAQVDVHARAASGGSPFDYFYGQLMVYRTGDPLFTVNGSDQPLYYSMSSDIIRPGGSANAFQLSYTMLGDGFYELPSGGAGISNSATDAALRVSFNSTTKVLTAYFDANGAVGGYNWTTVASIDVSGAQNWSMTGGNTFSLALMVNSGNDVFTNGGAYFDNFSVTAIPEPATYAIFASLGLFAFAVWHRAARKKPVAKG